MIRSQAATRDARARKRVRLREPQHNERRSKRLRKEPPDVLGVTSGQSLPRTPPAATKPNRSPNRLQVLRSPSSPASKKLARTAPEVIDLTGEDDEENTVATSAPLSPECIQPDPDTSPLASTRQRDEDDGLPYDTCFGLIEIPATISSSDKNPDCFPVKLHANNTTLMISALDSGQNLGSGSRACSPAICRVAELHGIVLTGTVEVFKTRRPLQYMPVNLRVVVYGFQRESKPVAKAFSDRDIYLQHPSVLECDRGVPYVNPQYLIRPGRSMPTLEELNVPGPSGLARGGGADTLTEVEKGRLLQIFESAQGPDGPSGIRASPRLRTVLKEHQIHAVAMMMEKECGIIDDARFPTIWEHKTDADGSKGYKHVVSGKKRGDNPGLLRGGILADEMGLGKTLSAIALILWHLDTLEASTSQNLLRATLIVTPKSTIPGWNQQFDEHVNPGRINVRTYHGSNRHLMAKSWGDVDVVITTYDTLKSDAISRGPLLKMRWARVILDEAHNIRNRATKVFDAAENIRAPCRWCLTGTPIQNSIGDLGSLISFIQVPGLETESQFKYWIADPVKDREMYAFKRLRKLVRATCLRRTKANAGNRLELPKKKEVNEVLDLDRGDRELYDFFRQQATAVALSIEKRARLKNPGVSRRMRGLGGGSWGWADILPLIGHLRRICDHGENLLPATALRAWRERDAESVGRQLIELSAQKCHCCGVELADDSDDVVSELACGHIICTGCFDVQGAGDTQTSTAPCPKCSGRSPMPMLGQKGVSEDYKPSVKVRSLVRNIRSEQSAKATKGDGSASKSVVFSCWTKMLDFVQAALRKEDISFRRVDGRTTLKGRDNALKAFRDDPDCRVLLASIGSVGEGVNLTVANHVHILEPHWNPMAEAQAIDRVHRIGQKRDVLITRYLVKDSIEFYVRAVQQDKLRLIHQSLSSTEIKQKEVDVQRFKKLIESLK